MNILEAMKSGRPFRRKSWDKGVYCKIINHEIVCEYPDGKGHPLHAHVSNILADDWEVREKSITITESQFDEAWEKYSHKKDLLYIDKDNFKKELGF